MFLLRITFIKEAGMYTTNLNYRVQMCIDELQKVVEWIYENDLFEDYGISKIIDSEHKVTNTSTPLKIVTEKLYNESFMFIVRCIYDDAGRLVGGVTLEFVNIFDDCVISKMLEDYYKYETFKQI